MLRYVSSVAEKPSAVSEVCHACSPSGTAVPRPPYFVAAEGAAVASHCHGSGRVRSPRTSTEARVLDQAVRVTATRGPDWSYQIMALPESSCGSRVHHH